MEKIFKRLSNFKVKNISLYRSKDLNNTAIYFTDVEYENRKTAKAYFDILIVDEDDRNIFLKYPNSEYFVELSGKNYGSGRGTMKTLSGTKDIWNDKYKDGLNLYTHDDNMLLSFNNFLEFNFLEKINDNNIINDVLSKEYLELPRDVYHINYLYKIDSKKPTYIIAYYPKYYFEYNNFIVKTIYDSNVTNYKLKYFNRYRDGGTTEIVVINNNYKEYNFYSPTPFDKTLKPTWNKIELSEVSDEEKNEIIDLLKLEI